jgi:DNA-binding IclR family transcriptional regulator
MAEPCTSAGAIECRLGAAVPTSRRELYAIAVPVRSEARDVVAAVNLAAPSAMITLEELVDALGPHLVSTAGRISARLGYRRDDELAGAGSL